MYKGRILKNGVSRVNLYTPGLPASGPHLTVLMALDYLYTTEAVVCEGKISDHIALAQEGGISADTIRKGFDELRQAGWITINGDIFTPIGLLLQRYH